ncbi:MAG: sulfotransferase family 2 domain-containing protein [Leptolyngbyaceae bacterium]|nr:sulfotransferase family 2 domain-containing protein [Leptolyngbyaceae bacterium]
MKSPVIPSLQNHTAPPIDVLDPHEALIFLHLTKTGGTSLFRLLKQHYAKPQTFHYGSKPGRTLQDFENLSLEQRAHLKFIHGHLEFGFHKRLDQSCRYITLLREPISRVVSEYYFLHQNPRSPISKKYRLASLRDFLSQNYLTVDNYQTRSIAGSLSNQFKFGECQTELLEAAKFNLAQFLWVGITDRFDESLLLLKHQLGLKKILYSPFNQNSRKPQLNTIDECDIEYIRALNQLDLELYQFGNELLSQAIEQIGGSFRAEYHLFQHANQHYRATTSAIKLEQKKQRKIRTKIRAIRQSRQQIVQMKKRIQNETNEISKSRLFRLLRRLGMG